MSSVNQLVLFGLTKLTISYSPIPNNGTTDVYSCIEKNE